MIIFSGDILLNYKIPSLKTFSATKLTFVYIKMLNYTIIVCKKAQEKRQMIAHSLFIVALLVMVQKDPLVRLSK